MQQKFPQRLFDKELFELNRTLAYLNPAFENIGMLCVDLELPTGKRISHPCGSAVYIGGRFLVTAAHCIQTTREATTISLGGHSLIKPVGFTFKLIDPAGRVRREYKIETEHVHSLYNPNSSMENDLALLKLVSKPRHLSGLQVAAESNIKHIGDCTATGFGMKGKQDGWFMSRDGLKRTVQVPAVMKDNSMYRNFNGYKLDDSKPDWHLEKIQDDGLAKGISLGMSGGALINDANQLLGITSHSFTPKKELFSESNPLETKEFKQSEWLSDKFRSVSSVLSYISSLPVPGLNPITGQGASWMNVNCDRYRNWLLDTMKLNSSPEEFSELIQFHDGIAQKEYTLLTKPSEIPSFNSRS